MRNHRRILTWAGFLAIVSILLAACGGGTSPAPTAAPEGGEGEAGGEVEQPTQAPTEAPEAQELFIGVGPDGYRTDPDSDGSDLGCSPPAHTNICEPLVRLSADYELVPWLAESWEKTGDRTWRFHLRQGVMFHNGDEMDAEAVKWTIDRFNRFFPFWTGGEVTAVDQYTVDISTGTDFWAVPESLAHPAYSIYSPAGNPGTDPIGTGPFMLDEYQQNEFIRVVKFDDYWGEAPGVDAMTFRFIPDDGARFLALQAGDVDMIQPVPRANVAQAAALPGVQVLVSEPGAYWALSFATKNQSPPYDHLTDVNLRRAINYAIDRETIVNQVYDGYAEVATTMLPPVVNSAVYDGVQGFGYDPDQARELLAESGWTDSDGDGIADKDGAPLSLTLVSGFGDPGPLPEVLQGQMLEVGIDLQLLEFSDVGAYYDHIIDTGEVHMVLEQGNANASDLSFLLFGVYCGCNPTGEASLYERFWINDEFDQAVLDTQAAQSADEAVQNATRAYRIIVDEFTGVAPIAYVPQIAAAAAHVKGYVVHPSNFSQTWASVTVER